MESGNTYAYITTAATTNLYGNELKKVVIHGIQINKALTGTLTIKSGSTTIGVIAASTAAGSYWISTNGIQVESANITNGSTEDVTVIYTNIG
jgi:hypothetical protein